MPIYEPKDPFSIEEHFKQFISASYHGMSPEDLHPLQLKTAKQAFFASWGQCLICLRDQISILSSDQRAEILDDMVQQTLRFFEDSRQ